MTDFYLTLWSIIPPLLLLGFYSRRLPTSPPWQRLLLFFIFGAISGVVALGLEWIFDTVLSTLVNWRLVQNSLFGVAIRQFLAIAPIEEGCKLAAVLLPIQYLQRLHKLNPSSIYLLAIAVALGFTAQENWVYLFYGTATISDRLIGTPVHAMFSAPWAYALAITICLNIRIHRYTQSIPQAWLISVVCHALVNILSAAWRYPEPLQYLSYGLFPFLLWLFWRMEQLFRRVQGKYPLTLISGHTIQERYWQRGLTLFVLMLGGNAILGLFLLVRILSPLTLEQIFSTNFFLPIFSRFLLNLLFGVIAWGIYRYLREEGRR